MSYASLTAITSTRGVQATPIQRIIPGREAEQVINRAGGAAFLVDEWTKLDRFLILGSEGSKFYASERTTVTQATDAIKALIRTDGQRVVERVVGISQAGRARNNDFALLVLAAALTYGNDDVKRLAAARLPLVARTGTHLMHFVGFANGMRGWGAALKRAVANWYTSKTPDQIAYQAVKYQSRDGWSQRDILRLAHPKAGDNEAMNNVFKYIVRGVQGINYDMVVPDIIHAVEDAKSATKVGLVKLIIDHRLSHEMIPNEMKSHPEVWEALYQHMGTTALIRNLNKLTSVGLIRGGDKFSRDVVQRLNNVETLRKDRIHPLQILIAQRQYAQGRGDRGSLVWSPDRTIVTGLESAFYESFQAVETTGKNVMLAVDVSGSMNSQVGTGATQLTCREAATVMAMVTARKEPNSKIFGFDHKFRELNILPTDTLAVACEKTYSRNFGSTDCSLPMNFATSQGWALDGFVVYTDNETNQGRNHPNQALATYRRVMNKPEAKLVSCGLNVSDVSIADPKDRGMMDVVGFDTAAPQLIGEFIAGRL